MKRLLVALLLMYPLSAFAQSYEWTDKDGSVHFTDDLGTIPKKFRKKAKVVGGDDSGSPQSTVTGEPAKGEGKGDAKGEAKGEDQTKAKKLYDGKDENAWRNAFKSARYDVQRYESELGTLRGRLGDTSNMSRSEYLTIQATIKNTEVRLQESQRKLEQVQQAADRAGVPGDFRQ